MNDLGSETTTRSFIVKFIADFFSVPVESITDKTLADDIQGWDSLANAEIILGLEEHLGVDLDVEELLELDDVGCLISAFEAHIAAST